MNPELDTFERNGFPIYTHKFCKKRNLAISHGLGDIPSYILEYSLFHTLYHTLLYSRIQDTGSRSVLLYSNLSLTAVVCVYYSCLTMKTMICKNHNSHRSSNKALDACAHGYQLKLMTRKNRLYNNSNLTFTAVTVEGLTPGRRLRVYLKTQKWTPPFILLT